MRPTELHQRLQPSVEAICQLLLPNGKRVGNEWCCGDTSGGEGDSLRVHLSGDKAGVWCDFASDQKGDLIGLYKAVKGASLSDSCTWAKQFLGIREDDFQAVPKMPKPKPIAAPVGVPVVGKAMQWLADRGLSRKAIDAFKLSCNGTVINLPYYIDDKVYHIKYKDIAKPPKESWHSSAGSTPILFGWQAVSEDCREIVITEGEWDAMAYYTQGIESLSIPAGAGAGEKLKWIELEWDRLEQFDTIYLSYDMDQAGQAPLRDVIARLGHHRVRVISLPLKDANECLLAGHDLTDFKRSAKYCDPPELRSMESFSDDVWKLFQGNEESSGDKMPWIKTYQQYRMRPGELTIWHGYSGHGKSMMLSMIMCHLITEGAKVCVASMELPAAKMLRRMYQQMRGGDMMEQELFNRVTAVIAGHGWVVNIKGTAKSELVLKLLDYAYRRYGVTHFVIDSLCKCGFDEDDYNGQKHFVDQLTDFTTDKPVHVHLVAHDRKDASEAATPGKMDVRGTSGITDMADNVIAVWRNKPKEEQPQSHSAEPDAFLCVQKQRHFDFEGKIGLWYSSVSHQYFETAEDKSEPMIEQKKAGETWEP